MKSVLVQSFSGQYFPAFGLDTVARKQSEFGKIQTRKAPNTDTFRAAWVRSIKGATPEEFLKTSDETLFKTHRAILVTEIFFDIVAD